MMKRNNVKAQKDKESFRTAWKSNIRGWKLIWKICPRRVVSSLLYSVVSALGPYVTVWLTARLVDALVSGGNAVMYAIWALACTALTALLGCILQHWKSAEAEQYEVNYVKAVADKFMDMDFADADSQRIYDLNSRIFQSRNFAGRGLDEALRILDELPANALKIIGGAALSASLFASLVPKAGLAWLGSPWFAPAMLALMLLAAFAASKLYYASESVWRSFDAQGRFGNRLFSFFGFTCYEEKRAADMRIYCQQENICAPSMEKGNVFGFKGSIAKMTRGKAGWMGALSVGVSALLMGFVYVFVVLKAYGGAFGAGAVTQYIGACTSLFAGISGLLNGISRVKTNGVFMGLLFELLDTPNNMYQGSLTTEKRSDRKYDIEFRNVSFKYPGSDTYALKNLNMHFKIGSRLAVVGKNGSGKTTFIKLLCRLYDPCEGEILLNGINIKKYRYDDYMNIFSVVFQDFRLLALPIGQNVASGVKYDTDRVTDCLERAGFKERLAKMPQGLDTYLYKELKEDGVSVSGGEAQKIAIARALYKDAPFIVLDEPTAALDPIAEAEIYSKFNDIAGDKTAIYISHRLSSCKFCDEIAVFDGGKVVQMGAHEQLVREESGLYYRLWEAQAQYYQQKHEEAGLI